MKLEFWFDTMARRNCRKFCRQILRELGKGVGLNGAAVAAAAEDAKWKDCLLRNTKEAEGTGVFGVPTVNAAGKLFFGNDRLEMLDAYLASFRN